MAETKVTADAIESLASRLMGDAGRGLVEDLTGRVEVVELEPGARLFSEGDAPDAAFFVVVGKVVVSVAGRVGEDVVLSVLGRGEVVGEMGLLHTAPRSATVTAIRPTTLLRLPAAGFEEIIGAHPQLLRRMTTAVLDRLQHPPQRIELTGTIAVAIRCDLGRRGFMDRMVAEAGRFGTVELLEGPPAGSGRLASRLDAVEGQVDHVFYSVGEEPSSWNDHVLRRADRLAVIAGDTDPDAARPVLDAVGDTAYVSRWLALVHPPDTLHPVGADPVGRLGADAVIHLRSGSTGDAARLARLVTGHGVGLALSGGGARALGHVGVLRAMEEAGVPVDAVSGSSMGAIIGAAIAQGATARDLASEAPAVFHRLFDTTYPAVSLYAARRIVTALERRFGDWFFEDLWLPFFCTSTNLTTSELETHRSGPLVPALRASSSIPGVFPPVPRDGDLLIDGGVLDNLPIGALRDSGMVGTVVAVDVAPPLGPRAKTEFGLSVSGWRAMRSRRHPRLSAVLMRSMLAGAMRDRNLGVADGAADLYLDLDLRGIPLLDFSDPEPAIQRGYESARPRIADWLSDVEVLGGLPEAEA